MAAVDSSFVVGMVVTLAWAVASLWGAYLVACRLYGEAAPAVRACAAVILVLWVWLAVFWLLAPLGLFLAPLAVGVCILLALWAQRRWRDAGGTLQRLRQDLAAARAHFKERFLVWMLLPIGTGLGLRVLRGLLAPPMAWDALTYHLVRSGELVQSGGLQGFAAPDAWGYYRYFPLGGSIVWAWAMLASRSDALLAVAGACVTAAVGLGVYAGARELEADRRSAGAAAIAGIALPMVAAFVTSAYVDTLVTASFALGAVFLLRALRAASPVDAAFCLGALAVACAVKHTMLPVAGFLLLVLGGRLWRAHPGWRRLLAAAIALAILAPGAANYLWVYAQTGNPLYPFGLTLAGRELLAGSAELLWVISGRVPDGMEIGVGTLLWRLLLGRISPDLNHMNFGPGFPLVLVLAVLGTSALLRRRGARWAALTLIAVAALNVALVLQPRGLRLSWGDVMARFLGPATVVVLLFASVRGGRGGWSLLLVAALASFICGGFAGLKWFGIRQALEAALLLAVLIAFIWVGFRVMRSAPARVALSFALAALFSIGLGALRQHERTRTYQAQAEARTYDLHAVERKYSEAVVQAAPLDDGVPRTLAVTGGFSDFGHNLMRYPFMGSRLTNRLTYVPITRDGSIVDYRERDATAAAADQQAWLQRLETRAIDAVVALPPLTCPEVGWIRSDRARFQIADGGDDAAALVARLRSRGRLSLPDPHAPSMR